MRALDANQPQSGQLKADKKSQKPQHVPGKAKGGPSKIALLLLTSHNKRRGESQTPPEPTPTSAELPTPSPSRSRRASIVWSQDSWVSSSPVDQEHHRHSNSQPPPLNPTEGTSVSSDPEPEWFEALEDTSFASELELGGSFSDTNRLSAGSTSTSRLGASLWRPQPPSQTTLVRSASSSSKVSIASSSNFLYRISHPLSSDEPHQPALLLSIQAYNRSLPPTPGLTLDSPALTSHPSFVDLQEESRKRQHQADVEAEAREQQLRRQAGRRQRAIHELVSTEATYAQDLVVIRDIYKACAEGQSPEEVWAKVDARFDVEPIKPTLSQPVPAWPAADVSQIFINAHELAPFSEDLVRVLDRASGEEFGLQSDDTLGAALLDVLPRMQELYQPYVEKHAGALKRLDQFTPESLEAYSALTGSFAQGLTQSWNLNALLIKPVQRCLKYPLLLQAIIDLTPVDHPDLDNLRKAHTQALSVASALNEGRRARELVERVLRSKSTTPRPTLTKKKKRASDSNKDSRRAPPPVDSSGSSASLPQSIMKKWGRKSEKTKTALGFSNAAVPPSSHDNFDQVNELAVRFDVLEAQLIDFGEAARLWSTSAHGSMRSLSNVALALLETCRPTHGEHYETDSLVERLVEFRRVLSSCEREVCQATIEQTEEILPPLERLIFAFKSPRRVIHKRHDKLLDYQTHHRDQDINLADTAATDFTTLSRKLQAELPLFIAAIEKAFRHFVLALATLQRHHYERLHGLLGQFQECVLDPTSKNVQPGELLLETWHAAHVIPRQQFLALPSCRSDEQIAKAIKQLRDHARAQEIDQTDKKAPISASYPDDSAPKLHMPLPRREVRWTPPTATTTTTNRDSVVSSNPSFAFSSPSQSSSYFSSEVEHLPAAFHAVVIVHTVAAEHGVRGKDYPSLSALQGEEVSVLVEEEGEGEQALSLVRNSRGEVGYIRTSGLVTLRR